jgi:hypothetical protein
METPTEHAGGSLFRRGLVTSPGHFPRLKLEVGNNRERFIEVWRI